MNSPAGRGEGVKREEEERDERWPTHFDPAREDWDRDHNGGDVDKHQQPPPSPDPAPQAVAIPTPPTAPASNTELSVPELEEPFPGAEKWKGVCWVNEDVRKRVERVCELARFMPGGGEVNYRVSFRFGFATSADSPSPI